MHRCERRKLVRTSAGGLTLVYFFLSGSLVPFPFAPLYLLSIFSYEQPRIPCGMNMHEQLQVVVDSSQCL
jgi:hypothetical protein